MIVIPNKEAMSLEANSMTRGEGYRNRSIMDIKKTRYSHNYTYNAHILWKFTSFYFITVPPPSRLSFQSPISKYLQEIGEWHKSSSSHPQLWRLKSGWILYKFEKNGQCMAICSWWQERLDNIFDETNWGSLLWTDVCLQQKLDASDHMIVAIKYSESKLLFVCCIQWFLWKSGIT